jgi:AcrR family transcriptional regulator
MRSATAQLGDGVIGHAEASRVRRKDALINHAALLRAAADVFAQSGLDAPLEEVARRAGVGIGTLYRHFPTRDDLVDGVLTRPLDAHVALAQQALALDDSWQGLVCYLEGSCALVSADRGIAEMMSIRLPGTTVAEKAKDRLYGLVTDLVQRAQEDGRLRADVTVEDLFFLTWSHGRILEATATVAPEAWRRHLELFVDGLRAERAHPLRNSPMTRAQVVGGMLALGKRCTGRP